MYFFLFNECCEDILLLICYFLCWVVKEFDVEVKSILKDVECVMF